MISILHIKNLIDRLWELSLCNFAPTEMSRQNLLNEGKKEESIFVTGNTAIDALKTTVEDYSHPELEWASDSRLIMLTAHRRKSRRTYASYV